MNDKHLFPFPIFQEPEHQPFRLEGQRAAVLLIHGFPGTPAEMRPLANVFHSLGWTVEGILLPGFGPQIQHLASATSEDWTQKAQESLLHLSHSHDKVLIGGFSMGAALASIAAARANIAGVLLLAPFLRLNSFLWSIFPFLQTVIKEIRPFRLVNMDLQDPQIRKGINNFIPDLNLNDPEIQKNIREFAFPTSIFKQVRDVGTQATTAVRALRAPVMVIQGRQDQIVRRKITREMIAEIPGRLSYIEVDAQHDLPDPNKPAWAQIRQSVSNFARLVFDEPLGK
jgi:carboxylesterase